MRKKKFSCKFKYVYVIAILYMCWKCLDKTKMWMNRMRIVWMCKRRFVMNASTEIDSCDIAYNRNALYDYYYFRCWHRVSEALCIVCTCISCIVHIYIRKTRSIEQHATERSKIVERRWSIKMFSIRAFVAIVGGFPCLCTDKKLTIVQYTFGVSAKAHRSSSSSYRRRCCRTDECNTLVW